MCGVSNLEFIVLVKAWSFSDEGEANYLDGQNLKPFVCSLERLREGVVIPLAGRSWFLQLVWNENWDIDLGRHSKPNHGLVFRETDEPISDLEVRDYIAYGVLDVQGSTLTLSSEEREALLIDLENGIPVIPLDDEVEILGQPHWPDHERPITDQDAIPLLAAQIPGGDCLEMNVFVSLTGEAPKLYISYDFS